MVEELVTLSRNLPGDHPSVYLPIRSISMDPAPFLVHEAMLLRHMSSYFLVERVSGSALKRADLPPARIHRS